MRALALLTLLSACGSDDTDATPDGETPGVPWIDAGRPDVAPPEIPWLETGLEVAAPVMTCLPGWTPTGIDNGATICEPWPTSGMEDCTSDSAMHLPGTAGCAEVGSACPAGDWPEGLPATGVWYVAPGGTGTGTSLASPLGTLAAAVAAASAGDTIALAKGTHPGATTVTGSVSIVGACAAETVLTDATLTEDQAVLSVNGGTATLRDLQIADASGLGVDANDASLTLEGVVLRRNTGHNLRQDGGTALLQDVLVADGRPRGDGLDGDGVSFLRTTFVLQSVVVRGNTSLGVGIVSGGGSIEDSAVIDTQPPLSGGELRTGGDAVSVAGGAALDVVGAVLERGQSSGLRCWSGANCTLTDAVVRDFQTDFGDGIGVEVGGEGIDASLVARRVYVADNGLSGFIVWGSGADPSATLLDLQDVVVSGVEGTTAYGIHANGPFPIRVERAVFTDHVGWGIIATDGEVVLTDVRVERSRVGLAGYSAGLTVQGARLADQSAAINFVDGRNVQLSDVHVTNAGMAKPARGVGVALLNGEATGEAVTMSRVLVEDVAQFGVLVQNYGVVDGQDLVVRRVAPGEGTVYITSLQDYGLGMNLSTNAAVSLARVDLRDLVLVGLGLSVGPASVTDLFVQHVASQFGDDFLGVGVFLEDAAVEGDRWIVEDTRHAAVGLSESQLVARDVRVDGVAPRPCAETLCTFDPGAVGVYANEGSAFDLTRFLITGAQGIGAAAAGDATLTDGYLRDTPVALATYGEAMLTTTRVDTSGATAVEVADPPAAPSLRY